MRLPVDYPDIVAARVRVLHSLGTQLRAEAERRPKTPELWLAVRDVEGLAERLADPSESEWQRGFADTLISGQDLGVLDELLTFGEHGTAQVPRRVTDEQAGLLARLRVFLQRYCDREFELDEP